MKTIIHERQEENQTNYTPGPWTIVQDAPENPKARFQIGHRTGATSATYVCTLRAENNITHDGKQEANALLIAAAPDLLKSLRDCQASLAAAVKTGQIVPKHMNALVNTARAAIAKAIK